MDDARPQLGGRAGDYSARSARTGSIRVARSAGIIVATSATAALAPEVREEYLAARKEMSQRAAQSTMPDVFPKSC